MHSRPSRYLSSFLFAAAACGGAVCGPAFAAELGDVRIASYIGQPLAADIELSMVEDGSQPVAARVADREVYSGAGIAMPAVLSTLHLSTVRRDGRQFLHVTSLRPIDGDHLHLYLELVDHGQRSVRLVTLWLTPDPNPAPPAAAVAAIAPAKGPVVPVTFDDEPVAPRETRTPRLEATSKAAAPSTPPVPAPATPRRAAAVAAAAPSSRNPAAVAGLHAAPVPAPACGRPSPEAQACVVLGAKNAELRAQLGSLEQKVRGLQTSLNVAPVSQPPPHEAEHAPAHEPAPKAEHEQAKEQAEPKEPPRPKSIHAIKPLVPRKQPASAPEEGLPWGVIGAAVGGLAAAAAGAVVLRRRRRGPAPVAEAGVEPVLE